MVPNRYTYIFTNETTSVSTGARVSDLKVTLHSRSGRRDGMLARTLACGGSEGLGYELNRGLVSVAIVGERDRDP